MTYFTSTRHPWSSFLFVVPLLAAYEWGVSWLGGEQASRLRFGADGWLRSQLEGFGAHSALAAPIAVAGFLLLWSLWRWADRPADPVRTWFGMAFESAGFAFLLWQFSQNFGLLADRLGVRLEIVFHTEQAGRVLAYLGAGIYEEVLFRLGLFAGGCVLLRCILIPGWIAVGLAAVGSALAFAAAHHAGNNGEAMNAPVFVFRALAGLYFALLYATRGLGIAVGAHAGYDVIVGTI